MGFPDRDMKCWNLSPVAFVSALDSKLLSMCNVSFLPLLLRFPALEVLGP